MNGQLTHWAPMNMGSDGKFGTGPTKAKCGLEIPDRLPAGPYIPHSNVQLHVTCEDCLAVGNFEPPDRANPMALEAWLTS